MNRNLIKTTLLISLILALGFGLAGLLANRTIYRDGLTSLEQITRLTAEGIHYRLAVIFDRPVNVVQAMAQDTFLGDFLTDAKSSAEAQAEKISAYLSAYHEKYDFVSVSLVDVRTGAYYSYRGFDREVTKGDARERWFYRLLDSPADYLVNIDNNSEASAGGAITFFVNCKVKDATGQTIGVLGVGVDLPQLRTLIAQYEEKYDVRVVFADRDGQIELASGEIAEQGLVSEAVGRAREAGTAFWEAQGQGAREPLYLACSYLPELGWYTVIINAASRLSDSLHAQILNSVAVFALITALVITVIIFLIRRFNHAVAAIVEQRHELFKTATGQLYEDILEWNLDRNRPVDRNTREYLAGLGKPAASYDDGLKLIADSQIAPEFRDSYLEVFGRKNIIDNFRQGIANLRLDFRAKLPDGNFRWLREDGHIFYSPEDKSLHMFTYTRNIDSEKHQELLANMDEMTGCYTKKATERMIEEQLADPDKGMQAFFILDIDNFKQANDGFGHAFGDLCIKRFAATIKSHFRENDIVGRLGGDEFAVFIAIPSMTWLAERTKELSRALNFTCSMDDKSWQVSASIGVAVAPENGQTFAEIYRSADAALYQTKRKGKNGYNFAV